MSTSFEMPEVDVLTTGAIGLPGQRVFYLQARQGEHVVTLRLEKTQVAALVTYLDALLADLPSPDDLPTDLELLEPVVAEWIIGSLGVSYDEDADRIVLLAEELVEEGEPAASARLRITRAQAAGFVEHARALVAAGRPPCPFCAEPLDPSGHVCPRANGYRR